jgi:hypothetical protein
MDGSISSINPHGESSHQQHPQRDESQTRRKKRALEEVKLKTGYRDIYVASDAPNSMPVTYTQDPCLKKRMERQAARTFVPLRSPREN